MPEITFAHSPEESAELAAAEAGLFAHANESGNDPHLSPLHLVARNSMGEVVGACGGQIMWGDLYIDLMWVAGDLRGQGIGSELMRRIETEARRRGCFRIHLDTMSFQAPHFYPRLGYREFARLGGYANGAERLYFVKELESIDP